ncbi:MAG: TM2 domain-containing protein [Rhodobacteraceae bacterium]|nr:TM2 domain-containing protein [Paracoccaceae bacterium]
MNAPYNSRDVGVAYLLALLFGFFGAHRFYLGRPGTAVLMIILTITVYGMIIIAIWWLIDLFLIPGWVREFNYGQ